MAGESPDKSEQQKSSGETTRGEHDPRFAVFREGEAEGGGSAVAVVDEDPKAGAEADPEAEADTESSVRESESDDAIEGVESGGGTAASGKPVEPVEPVEPAEPARSAESGKSGESGESGKADESGKPGESDVESDEKSDEEPSGESVDRRTAVLRTLKTDPADDKSPRADDEAPATPVDRPTAAFGVLRQKEAPRWAQSGDNSDNGDSGDSGGNGGKAEKAEESADVARGGEKAADAKPAEDKDEVKAENKDKDKDKDKAEGKATEKPAEKPAAKAAEKPSEKPAESPERGHLPAAAGGSSERTSRFVPLKSADDAPSTSTRPPAPPSALPGSERTRQQPLPESERTRQQPLPPAGQPAPIDLLAQLTNTPPPPETPLRAFVRRVKIWTPLAVLLLVVLGVVQVMRPLPQPELKPAEATYTFEGDKLSLPWPDQGQSAVEVKDVGSLGTSGAQKPVPIASVTKVMTAYIVLKGHPLKASQQGPTITIDAQAGKEANSQDESRVPVEEGQTFTERQMLEMLLIPSGNNIARRLARWDAGSEEAFVKKMNDAAKDLGMKNTVYTDPSGFKATTKSTASDQLKLARAVMQSKAFRAIVATPNIKIPGIENTIYNNNNLLVKPGVIGIKTGSSTPAGGALMWGAERTIDGKKRLILGVVLEQRAPGILQNSLDLVQTNSYKLISAVQDGLTSATVAKKGEVVGHIDDGMGGTTPLVAARDLTAVGWGGFEADLELTDGGKTLPHSAKAGTVVGELSVGSGANRATVPVALQKDLSEPSFGSKLVRIA